MTLSEIQRAAAALPECDRITLQAFLLHIGRVNDPSNQHVLGEQMRRMDEGDKISLDKFIHENSIPPDVPSP